MTSDPYGGFLETVLQQAPAAIEIPINISGSNINKVILPVAEQQEELNNESPKRWTRNRTTSQAGRRRILEAFFTSQTPKNISDIMNIAPRTVYHILEEFNDKNKIEAACRDSFKRKKTRL